MKALIAVIVVLLNANIAQAQTAELCHITNAGFFASDGEKSVLLDALLADGLEGYSTASDDLNQQMETAAERFSTVKLVFASHYHDDHMKGGAILRHLRANKDATAIVTAQAFTEFEEAGITTAEAKRVRQSTLKIGEQLVLENMPFPTTLFGISHGEGRPIENIGIAIEVAGKTIMHVGDMFAKSEDLKKAGINNIKVDYLLLPVWYFQTAEFISFINDNFNAKYIVPMHIPPAGGAGARGFEKLRQLKEKVYNSMDNIVRLDEELMCISIND